MKPTRSIRYRRRKASRAVLEKLACMRCRQCPFLDSRLKIYGNGWVERKLCYFILIRERKNFSASYGHVLRLIITLFLKKAGLGGNERRSLSIFLVLCFYPSTRKAVKCSHSFKLLYGPHRTVPAVSNKYPVRQTPNSVSVLPIRGSRLLINQLVDN